jgi:peptidoglycan/xylan/chitin deacetylase (PgdA/CDA1 family)
MISATPRAFDQQMRYLAERFRVVSIHAVLGAIQQGRRLPRRAVLLTFDDAYGDFAQVAWPILKQYRLPVTLFVPTAYPSQPQRGFWWDRLYQAFENSSRAVLDNTPLGPLSLSSANERRRSLRKLQDHLKTIPHSGAMTLVERFCDELGDGQPVPASILNWDQLRRLASEGVTLGAHTRTHAVLTQLPLEQAREEVRGSQQDLRREIGEAPPVFCYPSGAHNQAVVRLLKEEGMQAAFTTLDGQNRLEAADPLRLRRTNITRRTSLPVFRLRLVRLVSYFDRWRHRKQ